MVRPCPHARVFYLDGMREGAGPSYWRTLADCAQPHRLRPFVSVCAGGGLFAVQWGSCTVDSTATCFRSPNYPDDYDNYAACAITVTAHQAVVLSAVAFSTEPCCDFLNVAGRQYSSATSSPDGVQVAAGTPITFTSDGSVTGSGFEICGVSLDERKGGVRARRAFIRLEQTAFGREQGAGLEGGAV